LSEKDIEDFVKRELETAVREYANATLKFSSALQDVAYKLLKEYNLSEKQARKVLEKHCPSDTEIGIFMRNVWKNIYERKEG